MQSGAIAATAATARAVILASAVGGFAT